jgi:ketosteroid isomerase-like protein
MRVSIVGLVLAACLAGPALAQAPAPTGSAEAMAAITRFTDAVNHGDMAGALGYLGQAPTVVDDLAPYRWQGPGAGAAWMGAMGANAQAKGMTVINMQIAKATRIEVDGASAYAVVPGVLTFTFKDGHSEHADGVLTFALQRVGEAWKIDALTWTGPRAVP